MLDLLRVCVISANLAQNRVRLIHGVDLYMSLYGKSRGTFQYFQKKNLKMLEIDLA